MENNQFEVVHCETQEQWDFVKEMLGYTFLNKWNMSKQNSCISTICSSSGDINWYKERNSKIYSFNDWCTKFNHQFEEFKVGHYVISKNELCVIDRINGGNTYVCIPLNENSNWSAHFVSSDSLQKATVEQIAEYTNKGRTNFKSEEEFKVGDWVYVTSNEKGSYKRQGDVFQVVKTLKCTSFSGFFFEEYKSVLSHRIRKALPHEIPQSLPKISEMQPISGTIDVLDLKCYGSLQELAEATKQEYKVEEGYLPYPEPIVSLQSILSSLND